MKKILALGLLAVSTSSLLASCSSTGATDNLKSLPNRGTIFAPVPKNVKISD